MHSRSLIPTLFLLAALLLGHGFALPHHHDAWRSMAPLASVGSLDNGHVCLHATHTPHFEQGNSAAEDCNKCNSLLELEQAPMVASAILPLLAQKYAPTLAPQSQTRRATASPLDRSPPSVLG